MLFRNIVSKNTTDVAIGPLEYCGSGRMVKTTQGKKVYVFRLLPCSASAYTHINSVALCWNDTSSFSSPLLHREIAGLHRRSSGLDKPGTSKSAMSQRQRQRVNEQVQSILSKSDAVNSSGIIPCPSDSSESLPRPKRQRISQDKYIVAQNISSLDQGVRTRRSNTLSKS